MFLFKDKKSICTAVIVAAGSGTRMGLKTNKVLLPLAGEPIIAHTIGSFELCYDIAEIIVVARKEDIPEIINICKTWNFQKVSCVIAGGETRQESVYKGLLESSDYQFVAIHDAARCLIMPEEISNTIKAAKIYGAAALGIKAADTLKKTDEEGNIIKTISRQNVWQVQTPQVFKLEDIKNAHQFAIKENFTATDDCELVEKLGIKIKMVEGSNINFKITTPDDLSIAQALIGGEGLA